LFYKPDQGNFRGEKQEGKEDKQLPQGGALFYLMDFSGNRSFFLFDDPDIFMGQSFYLFIDRRGAQKG
jgi:hypothetical protein